MDMQDPQLNNLEFCWFCWSRFAIFEVIHHPITFYELLNWQIPSIVDTPGHIQSTSRKYPLEPQEIPFGIVRLRKSSVCMKNNLVSSQLAILS